MEAVARRRREGVELEGEIRGACIRGQLSSLDCELRFSLKRREPPLHRLSDRVAHAARPRVVLNRRGGEEAAAGHHLALVVGEPCVAEGEQPTEPRRLFRNRLPHLAPELLDGGVEGRELQLLLRAEEAEDAGFPHVHPLGEGPDG